MLLTRIFKLKTAVSFSARRMSCWSCGNDVKSLVMNLFCPSCNTLQKPDNFENYFKLLGVNETYDVDTNVLAKRYKDLQKFLHPDKFANRNKQELEVSEKYSSLVNEAYNTLLQPLSRGVYMLQLRGLDIPEQTEVDQSFLMKIMEINEEVENAESEEDIMKLNTDNKLVLEDLQKQLSKAFYDGDLKKVVKILGQLKYYTSIDNQIQSAIRSKGIIR